MDRRISLALIGIVVLALGIAVGLSIRPASPAPTAAPVPTQNLDAVRTEAVSTFAADMTGTVAVLPTATPTDTQAAMSSAVAVATDSTGGPSPTPGCNSLRFVRDVTIPDNTQMTPAQVFTKSWLVENNGTCPWQAGYQVVLIGGVPMGGSPFPIAAQVGPGGRIQVSIKMVAPTNQTGIVQGTWKMADATGTTFGDAMWVTIVVGSGTGGPPTLVPPATSTP